MHCNVFDSVVLVGGPSLSDYLLNVPGLRQLSDRACLPVVSENTPVNLEGPSLFSFEVAYPEMNRPEDFAADRKYSKAKMAAEADNSVQATAGVHSKQASTKKAGGADGPGAGVATAQGIDAKVEGDVRPHYVRYLNSRCFHPSYAALFLTPESRDKLLATVRGRQQ